MAVTFETMPAAVDQILSRMGRLEAIIGKKIFDTEQPPTDKRRLVKGAKGLAKYLKDIPKSSVYQMTHRGSLDPAIRRMPGSRILYFDLDVIDELMAGKKEIAEAITQ